VFDILAEVAETAREFPCAAASAAPWLRPFCCAGSSPSNGRLLRLNWRGQAERENGGDEQHGLSVQEECHESVGTRFSTRCAPTSPTTIFGDFSVETLRQRLGRSADRVGDDEPIRRHIATHYERAIERVLEALGRSNTHLRFVVSGHRRRRRG
jgi:hypothetical protein